MEMLLRGAAIGFLIAAGFGPIGLLTVRRTLESGFQVGLSTGLGAAAADATYAAIAALGGSAAASLLSGIARPMAMIGGLVLVALGIRSWAAAARPMGGSTAARTRASLLGAWASTFGLTLSNPMTVLSFAAAFAALVPPSGDVAAAAALTIGVGAGSALWWLLLAGGVAAARRSIPPRAVSVLRVASAAALVVVGGAVVVGGLVAS